MGKLWEFISFAKLCNFLTLCLLISNQLLAIWVWTSKDHAQCILVHRHSTLQEGEFSFLGQYRNWGIYCFNWLHLASLLIGHQHKMWSICPVSKCGKQTLISGIWHCLLMLKGWQIERPVQNFCLSGRWTNSHWGLLTKTFTGSQIPKYYKHTLH